MSIPKKQPKTSALDGLPDLPEMAYPLRSRIPAMDVWYQELQEWWDTVRERIYEIEKKVSE